MKTIYTICLLILALSLKAQEPDWEELGPVDTNNESKCNIGRIHNITIDPNYDGVKNRTLYACTIFGGLWKSENDGKLWKNLNTDTSLPSTSVADIAINPQNNTLFIISGSPDYGISKYSNRIGNQNPTFSTGVYRSTNNGKTWMPINSGLDLNYRNETIRKILINLKNPNQLFVATSKGIYRTNNANAENPKDVKWKLVFKGIAGKPDSQMKGLQFYPNNSSTIYASGRDVYVSYNQGETWQSFTKLSGFDIAELKPTRINIAVTPALPDAVFAYIVASKKDPTFLYKFKKNSCTKLLEKKGMYWGSTGRLGIGVSPNDSTNIFIGSVKMYHSIGNSYFKIDQNSNLHDDIHAICFTPNKKTKIFCASDGGVSINEAPNLYRKWEARNNGLGISTVWTFDASNYDDRVLAGFQDCHTKVFKDGKWKGVHNCCDGYGAEIDDFHADMMFTKRNSEDCKYDFKRNLVLSDKKYAPRDPSGRYIQRTIGFEAVNHPKTGELYFTFSEIFKRKNPPYPESMYLDKNWDLVSNITDYEPIPWYRQIVRHEIAEANPEHRYIIRHGVVDKELDKVIGKVYKTINGDDPKSYIEVKCPHKDNRKIIPSDIIIDPENENRIWLSYVSYDKNFKVYFSDDGGKTWQNADPNYTLPNLPVNCLAYQKGTNDIIYAGTDVGVYFKKGAKSDWQKYGDFPNVRVQGMKINYCADKIKVATYGRGIWQGNLLPFDKKLPEIVIKKGETEIWDTDIKRGLSNNIVVENGGSLIIKGDISMPANGYVKVKKGGLFISDGGTISNNCNQKWQGVILHAGTKFELENSAKIKNAKIGVDIISTTKTRRLRKTITVINHTSFVGCDTAVNVAKNILLNTKSCIQNSTFKADSLLNKSDTKPSSIILPKNSKIKIQNNKFINTLPAVYKDFRKK